ncbi:MAG: hypothetical protein ACLPSW_35110 [Roseiarcus sp.]
MSDIGLNFPLWVELGFIGAEYWYAFVPAVLALVAIGWFGRALPMALRYAAWGAAGLSAVPLVLMLVLIVADVVGTAQRAAEESARHRTLAAGETVGTLFLPAGAVLAYSDETHRVLVSAALPRPTPVAGILLEGELHPITDGEWYGVLAEDQVIGDWPCRAGDLWFTPEGVVTRCTLAAGHRLAGYDLPPRAECSRNPATGGLEFQLPQDGPALRIAALDADLPPGGTLTLRADGALRRLYVPHEARMTIAGVALYDHIIIEGTGLTGELAEPMPVAGVTLPADTVVRLDLTTGKAEPTTRSPVFDP